MKGSLVFGQRQYPKFERKFGQNFFYKAKTISWPQIYSGSYLTNEYQLSQRESVRALAPFNTTKQNKTNM